VNRERHETINAVAASGRQKYDTGTKAGPVIERRAAKGGEASRQAA
jgi:hypothetical protein